VEGARPDNDCYANALVFHEYLLSWDIPFSFETLDSIWSQKLMDGIGPINYLLQKTDATGKPTEQIHRGAKEKSPYTLVIKRPIRNDHSEYLQVVIESPYKIVLGKMMMLLAASFIIAIILGYCLYLQIRMIIRQERIAEIRQDFTHAMVHDMKNPVTNILMSAEALKSGKLDDKIRMKERYFDIVLKEGNRLLAFANKILTIAKFEGHKIELIKRDMDLKEVIDGLTAEYLISPSKEIRFTTGITGGLVIHADPDYMVDVLRNLIDNAIKYSKETVTIQIKAEKQKKEAVIQIKDNGMGIALKDQKRIFNKFERTRSREKQTKSGFGLGLYYVFRVVSAHDGTIKVESVPDEFSEFTIRIPNKKV
jgi:two-component system phosphate regulon sensor histidine kinase PhoR